MTKFWICAAVAAACAAAALEPMAAQEAKAQPKKAIIGTIERLDPRFDKLDAQGRPAGKDRRGLHLDRRSRLVQARQVPALLRHSQQRRRQMEAGQGHLASFSSPPATPASSRAAARPATNPAPTA